MSLQHNISDRDPRGPMWSTAATLSGGSIHVLEHSVSTQESEVVITATVELRNLAHSEVFARLSVYGLPPLETTLARSTWGEHCWILVASVPLSSLCDASLPLVFAEALNREGALLASSPCGPLLFQPYYDATSTDVVDSGPSHRDQKPPLALTMPTVHEVKPHPPYPCPSEFPSQAAFSLTSQADTSTQQPRATHARRKRNMGLSSGRARRANAARARESQSTRPPVQRVLEERIQTWTSLTFTTPLLSMAEHWDYQELEAGRRLIQFVRVFDGSTISIRCEPFNQAKYDQQQSLGLRGPSDRDIISCIYRPDKGSHCITSVDLIRLLEFIVGVAFEVDEKNRIRRYDNRSLYAHVTDLLPSETLSISVRQQCPNTRQA
jgi:hypothetical protein